MARSKRKAKTGKKDTKANGANLGFESKLWAAADKLRVHPAAGITPAHFNPGTRYG